MTEARRWRLPLIRIRILLVVLAEFHISLAMVIAAVIMVLTGCLRKIGGGKYIVACC